MWCAEHVVQFAGDRHPLLAGAPPRFFGPGTAELGCPLPPRLDQLDDHGERDQPGGDADRGGRRGRRLAGYQRRDPDEHRVADRERDPGRDPVPADDRADQRADHGQVHRPAGVAESEIDPDRHRGRDQRRLRRPAAQQQPGRGQHQQPPGQRLVRAFGGGLVVRGPGGGADLDGGDDDGADHLAAPQSHAGHGRTRRRITASAAGRLPAYRDRGRPETSARGAARPHRRVRRCAGRHPLRAARRRSCRTRRSCAGRSVRRCHEHADGPVFSRAPTTADGYLSAERNDDLAAGRRRLAISRAGRAWREGPRGARIGMLG